METMQRKSKCMAPMFEELFCHPGKGSKLYNASRMLVADKVSGFLRVISLIFFTKIVFSEGESISAAKTVPMIIE